MPLLEQIIHQQPIWALVRSFNMDNVTYILVPGSDGVEVEHAIIDRGNGEFTSMLKSTYDEMIAAQSTPSVD
jgi:hypothetical protein